MISILLLSESDKMLLNQMGIAVPQDFPVCKQCGHGAKDLSHILNHCPGCGSGRTVSKPGGELGDHFCIDCELNFDLRDMLSDFF